MLNANSLVQETNLDNLEDYNHEYEHNRNQKATIYVYGNNFGALDNYVDDIFEFETNQYYSQPSVFNSFKEHHRDTDIVKLSKTTRYDMFKYLIKYFTNYDKDVSNPQEMCRFLAKEMHCECSDCGGEDAIGECEIETEYYKHFENIIEYNEL